MEQTPVSFTNRHGLRLFGILSTPRKRRADGLAAILLSPGVKMRVGPQGLYKRLEDLLTGLGITVLRFDFFGLGDSEGQLPEELLRDVYGHIEVGRFVPDTIDAMDWMERHHGTKRFILSGLCGGAITGLLAGAGDPRVQGLLALGITPILASATADPTLYMTAGQLAQERKSYLAKVFSPKAWLRLLTFKSDYRMIQRSLLDPLRRRHQDSNTTPLPAPEHDNASPLFPPAFFRMLETRRPMLLIFGGSDRLHWEFDEKFIQRHGPTLASLPPVYEVHVIDQANHVLSFPEWQAEMLDVSSRWLRASFPGDVGESESDQRGYERRSDTMSSRVLAQSVTSAAQR